MENSAPMDNRLIPVTQLSTRMRHGNDQEHDDIQHLRLLSQGDLISTDARNILAKKSI